MNALLFRQWGGAIQASLDSEHHTQTLRDIWEMVATGKAQFWPGERTCAVTTIDDDGPDRVITYWIVSGVLREMLALRPGVEAFARAWGCTQARFAPARPGWARVLKSVGFEEIRPGVFGKAL